MSPEQLQSKETDARSDLFSFGCVLYETLTGKRAFDGQSAASVIAAILEREPAPLEVARPLDRVVRRSLAKDPEQRFQTARDLKAALSWVLEQPPPGDITQGSKLPWVIATAALTLALIVVGAMFWRATRLADHPLTRLDVDLGPDGLAGPFSTVELSPDGSRLVFPIKSSDGKQVLATRLLSETRPAPLSGTENGRDPFFSPDGKWIGFFADGKMKKISAQGGAPVVLCEAPNGRGGSWGGDGNIIAALNAVGGLSRVSAEGGTPQLTTKGPIHRWPQLLPGNEAVLLTASVSMVAFEDANIAAASLKTGETKILVRGGYFGRYLPTGDSIGHLVYAHEGVLFAVPFDPARLELRGPAVPMLEDLAADPNSGAGQFSFSGNGNLVYRTGKVSSQSWPVSWLDNSGKTRPLIPTPGFYLQPSFSADGQQLALSKIAHTDRDIFVYDVQRDTMTRLTSGTLASQPVWSPDGKHIAFGFNSGTPGIGWVRSDGTGEIRCLLDTKAIVLPYSFFPDGRRLAYYGLDANAARFKIWTVALDLSDPDHPKPGESELFLNTRDNERNPVVSPNGRWIAYESDESGRSEVYVRSFPVPPGGAGGKWQISIGGGTLPIWSRDGRELFFQNPDRRIMVMDYEVKKESFNGGKPSLWSDQRLQEIGGNQNYDLAPDSKRFAIFPEQKVPEEKGSVHVTFLLNFFDELRRRAPATK